MRVWLKNLRQKAGMSQEDVAKIAGIDRAHYSNIEIGARTPRVRTAKAIAKAIGFHWTIFFDDVGVELTQKETE